MLLIAHRVNTRTELQKVPVEYGVEIDLRDHGSRLVLAHDPFWGGEDFEEYLKAFGHRFLILNVKSERIEPKILELLNRYNVKDYFFLDSSFPMMVSLMRQGEANMAVRLSEYEGPDTIMACQGKVKWVWVDCFSRFPLTLPVYTQLKAAGFRLCLVSPDLQGRPEEILSYKQQLQAQGMHFDAVCTKLSNISLWQ